MNKTRIRACLLGAMLAALPLGSMAAGLGKLTLKSALGEPLDAEIELVVSPGEDLGSVTARVASVDAYRDAGLTYSSALSGVRLTLEQAAGRTYLKATSPRPVNEAFLELLVELRYAAGRLVREYTMLLDPPTRVAEAAVAPVAAVEPPTTTAPAVAQPAAEAVPAPAAAPARAEDYEVKRGDTLSRIARSRLTEGVSLEQMLVALYRNNEQAFVGRNMNRLKAGSILRIPEPGQAAQTSQPEALGEVRAHARDWNAYRQQLAATAAAALPEAEPRQAAAGRITTAVEDAAPAKEPSKDVLAVSKGEAAAGAEGAKPGRAGTLREELIAKEKALQEANERVAMLEKNIKDMQQLLDIKNQELATLQKQAGVTAVQPPAKAPEAAKVEAPAQPAEAPKPAAEPAKPAEAPKPEAPLEKPKPEVAKPKPAKPALPPLVAEEPSLLDELLGNPLVLAGLGVVLVGGLGYVGFTAYRRRKAVAGEAAEPPAVETTPPSEFERTHILGPGVAAVAGAAAAAGGGEVDELLSDAANLMAWGRHAQAEDILREAMQKAPGRLDVQARLLEVYAEQKNAEEFEYVAKGLYSATGGQGPEWEKAAALGRALDPANPLYGGVGGAPPAPSEAPVEGAAEVAAPTLEMDFSAPTVEVDVGGVAEAEGLQKTVDFDLDLGAGPEATAPNLEQAAEEAMASRVDFDLGVTAEPGAPEGKEEGALDDTVINAATEAAEEVASIDFDLGLGETEAEAAMEAPAVAAEAGAADLGPALEMPKAGGEPLAGTVEERAEEAGGGIDFDFDIDLGDQAAPAAEAAEPAMEATPPQAPPELSLGEISLDLGGEQLGAAGETAGGSSDVPAKLDLAKAYQEMGDIEGASEILQEVLREGNEGERQEARDLLAKLSA